MKPTILRPICAAFDTSGGGGVPPQGRGPVPRGRRCCPAGARAAAAVSDARTALGPRVRAAVRARAERETGLRGGGAGAGTRLRPRPGGKRGGRAEEAGLAHGRQARDALPRPPPPPRSRARARQRGGGGGGRPGADPERRRVCARRPPRARLPPPRVTPRPSAHTSSIRPDRPPAPRPSITRRARAAARGAARGGRAGRAGQPATRESGTPERPECTRESRRLCVSPRQTRVARRQHFSVNEQIFDFIPPLNPGVF